MSICPVRGSMLDCCMDTFISRTASLTSCTVTTADRRMRAWASAGGQKGQGQAVGGQDAVRELGSTAQQLNSSTAQQLKALHACVGKEAAVPVCLTCQADEGLQLPRRRRHNLRQQKEAARPG